MLHPSFLRKAHSVPMSLFSFSHHPKKDWEKSEGFAVGHNRSKSQHPKRRVSHLMLTCCFLQKNERLFVFAYGYVGCVCVCVLYKDCLLWSWVPLSFRAVAFFKICSLSLAHISLSLSFRVSVAWFLEALQGRTLSYFWCILFESPCANSYTSYLHS